MFQIETYPFPYRENSHTYYYHNFIWEMMVKEHWCCGNAETQGNPSTLSGTLLKNCTGQRFSEGICASENYRLDTTLGQCAEAISKRKCIQTVGWSSPAWFQEQRLWTVLIYTHLIPFCKCICLFCVIVMLLLKRVKHVKHIMNTEKQSQVCIES